MMLDLLARNWWLFALRGVAAVAFGVVALVQPFTTIGLLVLLFAAYVFVDGVSMLIALLRGDPGARRHAWAVAIMAVLGIVVGIFAVLRPDLTAVSLLYLVAFWSIVLGLFQIVAAIRLRREIDGELWMVLGGIVTVLFGIYIAAFPGAGFVSLAWLIGFWAIVFGVINMLFAMRVREHRAPTGLGAA